jgi:nicotinamidase-related amidase
MQTDKLVARPALVLHDFINGNFETSDEARDFYRSHGIVTATQQAIAEARASGIQIVWITVARNAEGLRTSTPVTDASLAAAPAAEDWDQSWGAANIADLPIDADNDVVVKKHGFDPFVGTGLELHLRTMGIDTIIVGGVSTSGGLASLVRTGYDLGFSVVVLEECCADRNAEGHAYMIERMFPRYARVRSVHRLSELLQTVLADNNRQ